MVSEHGIHTATLLNDSTVLIAGGFGESNFTVVSEIFDRATHLFTRTGSLATARSYHRATLLNNGDVLVTGGRIETSQNVFTFFKSAEVYK
jgi:hypothetical protein